MTSLPASVELAWGETPECINKTTVLGGHWGAFSLTGLAPGKTYYYRIDGVTPHIHTNPLKVEPIKATSTTGSFTTAATGMPPTTYFVSVDGDDSRDGSSPALAWRSVSRAADQAKAGDTVLIGGGIYVETVRVRATGVEGKPVTFKALPGQKVTLDGQRRTLGEAFILAGKNHINIDALYFGLFSERSTSFKISQPYCGLNVVYRSDHVSFTRCFTDGRGPDYQPDFVFGQESADLLIKNCAIVNGHNGPNLVRCPGFRLENSVLLRNLVSVLLVQNNMGQPADLIRNIITDNLSVKVGIPLLYCDADPLVLKENCFFVRLPPNERLLFSGISIGAFLEKVRKESAGDASVPLIVADPQFAGMRDVKVPEPVAGMPRYGIDDFLGAVQDRTPELDFPMLFTTNPELIKLGIGLQPEAFRDFHFHAAGNP
jgi:Chondroitinase B